MDLMTAFGSAAGGVRDAFNIGTGIYNIYAAERQRHDDATIRREQYAREDNAVQRRVRDLVAAGLSPVLAAGGSAGSQPISSSARSPVPGIDTGALQAIRINKAQSDMLRAQESKARSDESNGVKITDATVAEMASRTALNNASAASQYAQIQKLGVDIAKLNQEISDLEYNRGLSESGRTKTGQMDTDAKNRIINDLYDEALGNKGIGNNQWKKTTPGNKRSGASGSW